MSMVRQHVVGKVGDIAEGTCLLVSVDGREIGVFNIRGKYYALPNICIHQSGPLCRGIVSGTVIANAGTHWEFQWAFDGEVVTCPWHGLEFNITTGQCLAFSHRRLRAYQVLVESDRIILAV